jgi:hypothetical protein
MTRNRAPVDGGYVRKTLSLPASLVDRIEAVRAEEPGLTMSSLMTKAAEIYISRQEKKKK